MTQASDAFSLPHVLITPLTATQQALSAQTASIQSWTGGVMTMWNPISYTNTVVVGPNTYRNLPVVSPNGLTEGTVLLAQVPGGFVVMGMLAEVGSQQLDPIRFRALPADLTVSSATLANAGVLNFLVNAETQYAVDGALFFTASAACDVKFAWNGPPNMSTKWSMNGIYDSTFTTYTQVAAATTYGDTTTQTLYVYANSQQCTPCAWFMTGDTPGTLQLRIAEGPDAKLLTLQQGSWLRISELGAAGGAATYINQYNCTASNSYDHNGNPIGGTDGANNMYIGANSGRSYGTESSMWVFPGAQIRSDLAGAALDSAKAWFYCFLASSVNSVALNYYWHTDSTTPSTYPSSGEFGGAVVPMPITPPGWAFIDVTAQMGGILSGGANSMLLQGVSANYPGGFRGFGYSPNYLPHLQITFSK